MVHVRQVIEDGKVDGEDAHGGAPDAQRGHDPRDVREGGPAEPEEARGHEDGFEADEVEAGFGGGFVFAFEVEKWEDEFLLVDCEEGCDDGADADCWKDVRMWIIRDGW